MANSSGGNISWNFLTGAISGCTAITIIQPIDMIKVRIQLASQKGENINPSHIMKNMIKNEGAKSLYKGLDSALIRQCIYTSSRLGIFYNTIDYMKRKDKHGNVSMYKKSIASMIAGGLGATLATPADLILVRLQSDITLPPEQRRNYSGALNAFTRITKEEGISKLWTGALPTIVRAIAINWAMLAPFEEIKDRLKVHIPNNKLRAVFSSFIASFLASFISLPFDNVKTKLQHLKVDVNGIKPYSGITDCFIKTVKNEGFFKFWVGFRTYYVRIAPATVVVLLMNDFMRNLLKLN